MSGTSYRHKDLPEAKAAWDGYSAPTSGAMVWVLERCNGTLYGTWLSRHDAVGAAATVPNNQFEWFEPKRVPIGALPESDLRRVKP